LLSILHELVTDSLRVRAREHWNLLPLEIINSISAVKFKKLAKQWILDNIYLLVGSTACSGMGKVYHHLHIKFIQVVKCINKTCFLTIVGFLKKILD
jgi:hypothetical protein